MSCIMEMLLLVIGVLRDATCVVIWNPNAETAEAFQGRLCHERCNANRTELVDGVARSRCLQCFPCTCSPECHTEGTCCPSLDQSWSPLSSDRFQCTADPRKLSLGKPSARVLQVVKCEPNFPTGVVRNLCENTGLFSRTRDTAYPVTSKLTTITYANVYCAACNYDNESVVEWTVQCNHSQTLIDAVNDTDYDARALHMPELCGFIANKSLRYYHYCPHRLFTDNPISSCNVSGRWAADDAHVRRACEDVAWHVGASVVVGAARTYANVFCALCNGEEELTADTCDKIYDVVDGNRVSVDLLRRHDEAAVLETSSSNCLVNQWNHPQKGCQALQCATGKVLRGLHCDSAVARVRGLGYRLRLLLQPLSLRYRHTDSNTTTETATKPSTTTATIHESKTGGGHSKWWEHHAWDGCDYGELLLKDALAEVSEFMLDMSVNITTEATTHGICSNDTFHSRLHDLWIHEDAIVTESGDTEINLTVASWKKNKFLTAVLDADVIVDYKFNRETVEEFITSFFFDPNIQINVSFREWTVVLTAFDLNAGFHSGGKGQTDDAMYNFSEKNFPFTNNDGPLVGLERIFLPLSDRLHCPHLTFEAGEFYLGTCVECDVLVEFPRFLDPQLKKPVSFRVDSYPSGAWLTDDGRLGLCLETFQDVFPQNVSVLPPPTSSSKVLREVSLICGSVSVLCLALTLLTYALFRELRALPGLNLMGLCASLLSAQLTLLLPLLRLTSSSQGVCRLVGVLTHWAWLASFAWMSVGCLHMARAFTAKTHTSLEPRQVRRVFCRNVLGTLSSSAGVVLLTAGVSLAASGGRSWGYGGAICFLDTGGSWLLLLLAFVLPLALVVLANLTCFLLTALSIARVRRLQAQPGGGEGLQGLQGELVYAKLVTVTGGAWLLSLLAQLMDSDWLRVLAELCVMAQGLVLFLAYVCTARVWRLYALKFGVSEPRHFSSVSRTFATSGESTDRSKTS